MKLYCVTTLLTVLVRCPVHTPVCRPMYGLPLSQSDRRILFVFQSVYNNADFRALYTIFDRMSARGAHLILGPRGEALIRTRRSFERGHSFNTFQTT